jgi:uncharacterized membrane protein (UPF0182 family)
MIRYSIACVLVCILTGLISYFLNKDYKLNGQAKKIITGSKYSRIAHYLSITMVLLLSILFDVVIDKYAVGFFSDTTCKILSWVISPLLSIICVASIYITAYSEFLARKKWGIKDDKKDTEKFA